MGRAKLSKAQISKEVRRVLARYQVNLTQIYFTAGMHSIHLSGFLVKPNGQDFSPSVVNAMAIELLKIGTIRSELENWYIGSDGVHFTGKAEVSKAS